MYELILIDDNPRDRIGIKNLLNWKSMNIKLVASYSNGKKALEELEKTKPDIILADIAMPVMNGLEMAKELRKKYPKIKIIFMSCYNEFDFAKSAIDLDIYAYVLKPIDKEELEQAFNKVIKSIKKQELLEKEKKEVQEKLKKSLPSFRRQFWRELIFGYYQDQKNINTRLKYLQINIPRNYSILVSSLKIDSYDQHNLDVKEQYFTSYSIQKIINSYNYTKNKLIPLQISNNMFVIIGIVDIKNVTPDTNNILLDKIIEIKEQINEKFNFKTTIGISRTSHKIVDVPQLYQQADQAINTVFYNTEDNIIFFEQIQENTFKKPINQQKLYKDIKDIVTCGNTQKINDIVNAYIDHEKIVYKNYIKSFILSVSNILQILLIEYDETNNLAKNQLILWDKLDDINSLTDMKNLLNNLFKKTIKYIEDNHNNRYQQIVRKILDVIKDKFNQQITISDIAEEINYSPSHANNIFKQEMNKTIFEYLTEYRIQRAKELLKNPQSRIYIVTEQVGYTNKSHFTLQFKKHTGLTPSEYKNKVLLK